MSLARRSAIRPCTAPAVGLSPPTADRATASPSSGSAPGRTTATGQSALPSSPPAFKAGISPARASDDLPLPEAPRTARKRFSWPAGVRRRAVSSHSVRASRPKKKRAWATSKNSRPR